MKTGKFAWKPRLFLWLAISLILSGCDIYRAFKENREMVQFLNRHLNSWQEEESQIAKKYNLLIEGERFDSKALWDELEQTLLPAALALRNEVTEVKTEKAVLESLRQLFIAKLDVMLEGFDMLREGLKKKDNEESSDLIYQGRLKLKEVERYNRQIEEAVLELIKTYYIEPEAVQEEKKEAESVN